MTTCPVHGHDDLMDLLHRVEMLAFREKLAQEANTQAVESLKEVGGRLGSVFQRAGQRVLGAAARQVPILLAEERALAIPSGGETRGQADEWLGGYLGTLAEDRLRRGLDLSVERAWPGGGSVPHQLLPPVRPASPMPPSRDPGMGERAFSPIAQQFGSLGGVVRYLMGRPG